MNFRTFLPTTIIFSLLISLIPAQTHADPSLEQILLFGGAAVAGLDVLTIAQNRPKSGLTLMAIGAGMAAVAKPDQVQRIFDNVTGKSKSERILDSAAKNVEGISKWFKDIKI